MFGTPVAYPIRVIREWLKPLYMLNPMAPIIDGYRRAFLLGQAPDLPALAVSALITIAITTLRSEEHTSELQSHLNLVCRLLLEKKKTKHEQHDHDPAH